MLGINYSLLECKDLFSFVSFPINVDFERLRQPDDFYFVSEGTEKRFRTKPMNHENRQQYE